MHIHSQGTRAASPPPTNAGHCGHIAPFQMLKSVTNPQARRRRRSVTDRQLFVLAAASDYMARHGWSPSIRDLMDATGIQSLKGITGHLEALHDHGLIVRGAGNRQLAITIKGAQSLKVVARV